MLFKEKLFLKKNQKFLDALAKHLSLLDCLPGNQRKSTELCGLCSKERSTDHLRNNAKTGIGPYSTPRSSPNAEGLQTNHHNRGLSFRIQVSNSRDHLA